MDQNHAPYYQALLAYAQSGASTFHLPGHTQGRWASPELRHLLGAQALSADVTCVLDLDDIHAPSGPLQLAQRLAADLYGMDRTWFMVNGSTVGNIAMIAAALRPGEKIILPRNVHHSVWSGLIMSGAQPIYATTPYDKDMGVTHCLTVAELERLLAQHPDCQACLFTNGTLYGAVPDTCALVECLHKHGALALVDEAWGAHYISGGPLPISACAAGADLVVHSAHKLLNALTQAAWLHQKGAAVSPQLVDEALRMLQSTSPNLLLLASLDLARRDLAMDGRRDWNKACDLAAYARERLAATSWQALEPQGAFGSDITRLVISARLAGLEGSDLEIGLRHRHQVQLEMADFRNGIAVLTPAHERDDVERLAQALEQLAGEMPRAKFAAEPELYGHFPPLVLTPRQAFYAPQERVPWRQAAGRICAQTLVTYPPGEPLISPGELIEESLVEYWEYMEATDLPCSGWNGRDIAVVRRVKDE